MRSRLRGGGGKPLVVTGDGPDEGDAARAGGVTAAATCASPAAYRTPSLRGCAPAPHWRSCPRASPRRSGCRAPRRWPPGLPVAASRVGALTDLLPDNDLDRRATPPRSRSACGASGATPQRASATPAFIATHAAPDAVAERSRRSTPHRTERGGRRGGHAFRTGLVADRSLSCDSAAPYPHRPCAHSSPAAPASSARISSTRCSTAATRSRSSTTSRTGRRENLDGALDARRHAASRSTSATRRPSRRVRRARARGRLPPRRADRRAQVGRRPRLRRRDQRRRHDQRARGRARARRRSASSSPRPAARSTARRDVDADARDASRRADGPLRPEQVRGRGLLRAVRPPLRALDGQAALRQRLRPAPGPARRGRRDRDLLPGAARRASAPTVFGDGTQTRDYIYVGDVVAADLAAAEHRRRAAPSTSAPASRLGARRRRALRDAAGAAGDEVRAASSSPRASASSSARSLDVPAPATSWASRPTRRSSTACALCWSTCAEAPPPRAPARTHAPALSARGRARATSLELRQVDEAGYGVLEARRAASRAGSRPPSPRHVLARPAATSRQPSAAAQHLLARRPADRGRRRNGRPRSTATSTATLITVDANDIRTARGSRPTPPRGLRPASYRVEVYGRRRRRWTGRRAGARLAPRPTTSRPVPRCVAARAAARNPRLAAATS